ncbi:NGG1 interacting factor 3-like protein [Roridomyces roridus]|uniref:NGG1 interacting factor 3-like protein n=1 Tax=Roridomyces roridus TaxID=1738132 RepID=A0AAD7FKN5_9AGAR|nr:NGG1 interacting factor 3-like protein [Roridomyces roridus]
MASSLVVSSSLTKAVCNAMKRIAPPALAGSWDNTGLIMESPVQNANAAANRVLLTIDITPAVCDEAISRGASMIVSYHTPIFRGLKALTLETPLQNTLLRCAAGGISVYSPHSALDSVFGGIDDWLAECIHAKPPMVDVLGSNPATQAIGGDGRCVTFDPPVSMEVLEGRIKKSLGLAQIQVGYSRLRPDRLVRTVAICAGSGASMFSELGTKADVYFTGEMEHHYILAAVAAGTHVVLCGHTNTERGYLPVLAQKLSSELQNEFQAEAAPFDVIVSEADAHPLQFV